MDVLIILVFVSLVLVGGGILLMLFSLNQRDFEHADRLSLLPLQEPVDFLAAPTSVANENAGSPSKNPSSSSNP